MHISAKKKKLLNQKGMCINGLWWCARISYVPALYRSTSEAKFYNLSYCAVRPNRKRIMSKQMQMCKDFTSYYFLREELLKAYLISLIRTVWVFADEISFTGLVTPTQSHLHSNKMFFSCWAELRKKRSQIQELLFETQHWQKTMYSSSTSWVIERSWFKKLIFHGCINGVTPTHTLHNIWR